MEADQESQTDPDPLVGTVVAERYRIEALLGAGAMGAVYRARHVHMHKPVALKVLHRETSENAEVVSRFEREAIAAGRIAHPNVAGATDFGRLPDGSFYLVLEYVAGRSLGALLAETGKLPVERALGIAEQIVSALVAAHGSDIVHRDLKPENVMLLDLVSATSTSAGLPVSGRATGFDGDVVKVLDFGLAKLQKTDARDTQLTQMGAVYGTPQYMAPEQAAGQSVDGRADLYSVGLMIYEMLSGAPPFSSDQMMPLLIMHMTEIPPPLPTEIPRPVRALVMKLLEKKAEDRFQSAEELLLALRALSERPVAPSPSSAGFPMPSAADVMDRLESVHAAARTAMRPAIEYSKRPLFVRGHRIPRGIPIAAVGLGLLVGLVVLWPDEDASDGLVAEASDRPSGDDGERTTRADVPPALRRVLDEAALGSDSALFALEQRSDADRSVDEWLALTQAYLMRRNVEKALDSFEKAIDGDESAREEGDVLGPLRLLADDEDHEKPILDFAAAHLGGAGADFLFHVWSRTSAKTAATTHAFELLESSQVKENMSPALELALAFRRAEDCEARRALFPKVIELGDERVLPRLTEMDKKRGCGKDERDDCFPCVRKDKTLQEAITQAAQRKAPQFPLRRSFRFKR